MRRAALVATLVLVLLGAGVAFAFTTGVGPLPGGSDAGDQSNDPFPTQTAAPSDDATGSSSGSSGGESGGTDGGDASSGDQTRTASPEPFAFTIDRIEECGQTCRDVTSTVTNRQSEAASGVTVYSRIYVGNSTDSDDVVWRGSEEIGDLAAGESYTATKRVQLSFSEAFAVQQADGWITVQTTIETDQQTLTYTERRDVV
jgi:hypothetical protein